MFETPVSRRSDWFHPALLIAIVSVLFGVCACGEGALEYGSKLEDAAAGAADAADATETTDRKDAGQRDAFAQRDATGETGDSGESDDSGESGDTAEAGDNCQDPDGDGYGDGATCVDVDCDETDAAIHPGQAEMCNGDDDNCDGVTDDGCACDFEGTSEGVCAGSVRGANGDCSQPTDYESTESACDNLDNDCDGTVDEGCTTNTCTDNDGTCPSGCYVTTDSDCTLDCRDSATWPPTWTDFEDEVLRLTNQERAAGADCGSYGTFPPVPAVTANPQLREAARCHSLDMADNDFYTHEGSNGSRAGDRITQAGYQWGTWAENIYATPDTPADAVAGWMNSDGHCKNIMKSTVTELGVGYVYENPDALNYHDYWTQVFGRPQ